MDRPENVPTWSYRSLGQQRYEVRRDRKIAALVEFSECVTRPSTLIRRLVSDMARHHGEHVDRAAVISVADVDWRAMGWPGGRREYDEFRVLVQQTRNAWNDSPLAGRCDTYFYSELERAGIEKRGPHTMAELNEIYEIALRTPAVVAQDVDAERGAA